MPRPTPEEQTHAAALVVTMVQAGHLEEAEDFVEWFLEAFDSDLRHALPAELEDY